MVTDTIEINKLAATFAKFRPKGISAQEHYLAWASSVPDTGLDAYTKYCFADAFNFIAKHADSEKEFYEWKLELDMLQWKYARDNQSSEAGFILKQIHIDNILLKVQQLGLQVDIIIQADNCCSFCARHHGRRVKLESVLKQNHLPYRGCKRADYCTCTYKVIPGV